MLAIQAENPNAGDVPPNAPAPIAQQVVSQHFHTTIIGGQANVGNSGPSSIGDGNVASVRHTQPVGLQDETVRQLISELRGLLEGISGDDAREASQAIERVEVQLRNPKPDFERIKQYLGLVGTIVTVAAPTVQKLVEVLGPLLGR